MPRHNPKELQHQMRRGKSFRSHTSWLCAPWWWCNCNTETCRNCFNV